VIAQDEAAHQIIVVDDGSTEGLSQSVPRYCVRPAAGLDG
jgi:hypothetical protein